MTANRARLTRLRKAMRSRSANHPSRGPDPSTLRHLLKDGPRKARPTMHRWSSAVLRRMTFGKPITSRSPTPVKPVMGISRRLTAPAMRAMHGMGSKAAPLKKRNHCFASNTKRMAANWNGPPPGLVHWPHGIAFRNAASDPRNRHHSIKNLPHETSPPHEIRPSGAGPSAAGERPTSARSTATGTRDKPPYYRIASADHAAGAHRPAAQTRSAPRPAPEGVKGPHFAITRMRW